MITISYETAVLGLLTAFILGFMLTVITYGVDIIRLMIYQSKLRKLQNKIKQTEKEISK